MLQYGDIASLDESSAYAGACTADPILSALAAANLAQSLLLRQTLVDHPELNQLRQPLLEVFGERAAMLDCSGVFLESWLPPALRACPVWYIRLPDAWQQKVPAFAAEKCLGPYVRRSDDDPWHIGQWLTISVPGEPWNDAPRLEIPDYGVKRSLDKGLLAGGVIAIFECAGLLTFGALAIDEPLLDCLNAGNAGSSRHPLFELARGEVQAMTRALEDGIVPTLPANVITLPGLLLLTEEEERVYQVHQEEYQRLREGRCPDGSGRCVRHKSVEDAAVGLLPTIVNYMAPQFDHGARTWMRITVDQDTFAQMSVALPSVDVVRLPTQTEGRDVYVVKALVSNTWIVAILNPTRPDLWVALDAFAATGRCDVAFENRRNGRILAAELQWPLECMSQKGGPPWLDGDDGRYERYPALAEIAETTARALRRVVCLQVSVTVGAEQWQRKDLQQRPQEPGQAGGLLRIVK